MPALLIFWLMDATHKPMFGSRAPYDLMHLPVGNGRLGGSPAVLCGLGVLLPGQEGRNPAHRTPNCSWFGAAVLWMGRMARCPLSQASRHMKQQQWPTHHQSLQKRRCFLAAALRAAPRAFLAAQIGELRKPTKAPYLKRFSWLRSSPWSHSTWQYDGSSMMVVV